MEEKEILLTSVKQLNEYLKEEADDKTVISVVLELAGTEIAEGGADNG